MHWDEEVEAAEEIPDLSKEVGPGYDIDVAPLAAAEDNHNTHVFNTDNDKHIPIPPVSQEQTIIDNSNNSEEDELETIQVGDNLKEMTAANANHDPMSEVSSEQDVSLDTY